jgi:hypothetical protein
MYKIMYKNRGKEILGSALNEKEEKLKADC